MCMVGDRKQKISSYCDPSIQADSRIADQPWSPRLRVSPQFASGHGIKGVHLIGSGDVHHAGNHHWCPFDHWEIRDWKKPLGRQLINIGSVDLGKSTVPVGGITSVVRVPIDGWFERRLNKPVTFFSEKEDVTVICSQLCVETTLV